MNLNRIIARSYWKIKRNKSRKKENTEILRSNGIPFECLDENGFHLRVADTWDFWPSTATIIDNRNGKKSKGIGLLVKMFKTRFIIKEQ